MKLNLRLKTLLSFVHARWFAFSMQNNVFRLTNFSLKIFCLFLNIASMPNEAFANLEIKQEILKLENNGEAVEYFWAAPEGSQNPKATLFLIHPHQDWPNKIGARVFVQNKTLEHWSREGFLTVAISQPGYGESNGLADFCGRKTQNALRAVIDIFKSKNGPQKSKYFIYGGSRGAILAAMIAAQDSFDGLVLKSGVYDLANAYESYSWWNPIKWTILWEIGFLDEKKASERSPILVAEKIKAPVLVIHGSADDRASIEGAKNFTNKINEHAGHAEIEIRGSEHVIPMSEIENTMMSFFQRQLK